jgi:23S rRNA (adenine1618-N6)-methyltransferase
MNSTRFHPRNRHNAQYNFADLIKRVPELSQYISYNPKGGQTIDFADPIAVKLLNKALLHSHYGIENWDIPFGYLCPPIPGRADYIHYISDLFSQSQGKKNKVNSMLDIGTGANCIYPLIAASQYGWNVVATDINKASLSNATTIVEANPSLGSLIELRLQPNEQHIFKGVILDSDRFDVTVCNPPFHRSQKEAQLGTQRKVNNLAKNKATRNATVSRRSEKFAPLNFGGKDNELWCEGGELAFVTKMANESADFSAQVLWFSTLLSKSETVRSLKKVLTKLNVSRIQVVEMKQGNKITRFVAWTFQNEGQRIAWNSREC